MKKSCFTIFLFPILIALSCSSPREKRDEMVILTSTADSLQSLKPEISFYIYEEKNDFPDAIIEMYSPLGNQVFRPGKVPFEFNIKNYPFDAGLSGFQLNMILNSGDPVGYNSPIFQRDLNEGTYRVVAYLIDGEGLSLKEFGNYVDRDFMVGDTRPFPYQAEPYIVLNMPLNNQKYTDQEEITIDFLVVGGDMNLDKLKVDIQLNEFHYELQQVTPVRIAHLPKGDYMLKVKLMRRDGKELDGPFSSVTKAFKIE
jgi:hypothetical protein